MATVVEQTAPTSLADADLRPRGRVVASPITWRDQVLYFLLPDRFSDGSEGQRPLFDHSDPDQFDAPDHPQWMRDGRDFQGGTLQGITGKLDYLHDLGVSTLWIGPVWRQRPDLDTYHGYGIQGFFDVDPRFGTRQDLRDLVDAAHDHGMYVLLDVIYNHSGNNWFYRDSNGSPVAELPYRFQPPYDVAGWRSAHGNNIDVGTVGSQDDAVWPREFQDVEWYTRAGRIGRWDPQPWEDPRHDDNEFRRGDFYSLKDLAVDRDEVLTALVKVYQYWIALSDCDGFRIDTVKHLPLAGSRNFCGAIHEYAEAIGKENFLLLGEVTGGSGMARDYLDVFGRNIDAVLDIGDPAERLTTMIKGFAPAEPFFNLFLGHDLLGSHRETGRYHVSVLDDHDMVGRAKRRFAAGNTGPHRHEQVAHAVGTQLTTLGIPCIYYGTEQAFDGSIERHDPQVDKGHEDRYIRETMFGGTFGAFHTQGCHFFDPDHPTYRRIAAIARLRNANDSVGRALRRGRMYLRQTRPEGAAIFALPSAGSLVAWSRILHDREVLVALNTNGAQPARGDVTVDAGFHPPGSQMRVRYRGEWQDDSAPPDEFLQVHHDADGRATIRLDLQPAGMAILTIATGSDG